MEEVVERSNGTDIQMLIDSFKGVAVIDKGGYQYFVHPLSDGIRAIDPSMLEGFGNVISSRIERIKDVDIILTAEAMGIPITSIVSIKTRLPFNIVRKRGYGLDGEVVVEQRTGYSSSDLYVNLPGKNGKLIIIDDVLSTGGTLRALAEGVKKAGWEVALAVVLFNKMGDERTTLQNELEFPIETLLDIEVIDGTCRVKPSPYRDIESSRSVK